MSTVFVDVLGFGIVIPILPFYVESFGVSPLMTTLLFATFATCSFVSSPLLGALSDRIGRRPVLIMSIMSTAIGWTVFASARSVPFLFLGRIIDGCAAGNFTTAQSYLVDISKNEKERSANLGLIGATFGIGFILGPMLGGVLSKISHAFPFWLAGGLAAINAVSAFVFLPESHHNRRSEPLNLNPFRPLVRAATDKILRPYYATWVLFAMAFVTGQSIYALYVGIEFGFSSFGSGMLFTGMGVIMTINQAFLLRKVWLRHFSNARLELIMIIVMGCGSACMVTGSLMMFYVGIALNAIAQAVLRIVITSEVAGHAPPHAKGETIGILASLMSASMAIAPVITGAAFEYHHTLPFMLALGYMALAFGLAYSHRSGLVGQPEVPHSARISDAGHGFTPEPEARE